jgi:hypothetical protein
MPEERWIIQRRQGSYPTIAGVVDMLRIRWSTCSGFGGRHAPDSVVGMLRIMQASRARTYLQQQIAHV